MYVRRVGGQDRCMVKICFLKCKFYMSKQYAAHSHMIVKQSPLLGGSGGMLPQENLKKNDAI